MVKYGSNRNHYDQRSAVFLRCGLLALVATAALITVPGCIQDPQARAEIGRLMRESKAAQQTVVDAFGKLDALVAKLKPLKEKIAAAWAKLKAKELPAAEVADIIGTLTAQKEALLAEISGIKQDIIKGKAHFETLRDSATKLTEQYNVNPWAVGGMMLLTLLGGATGTGLIARIGSNKLRGALQVAQSGLKIVTGALENAAPDEAETMNGMTDDEKKIIRKHQEHQRKAIKVQIAGTNNEAIEAALAEARTAVAIETVSSRAA